MQEVILSTYKIILLIHFIGFIVGFGAALVSDYLFITFAKDHIINKFEAGTLKKISGLVWIGVIIFTISGIFLFLGKPDFLLNSQSFIAKIFVVSIVIINGAFLHFKVSPQIRNLKFEDDIDKKDKALRLRALLGGFISISSWTTVLILAVTKGYGHTTDTILGIYFGWILLGLIACLYLNTNLSKFFK